MFTTLIIRLHNRRADLLARHGELDPETGGSTVEILAWAAVSTGVIVAVGAGLQTVGVDLISIIRQRLGL